MLSVCPCFTDLNTLFNCLFKRPILTKFITHIFLEASSLPKFVKMFIIRTFCMRLGIFQCSAFKFDLGIFKPGPPSPYVQKYELLNIFNCRPILINPTRLMFFRELSSNLTPIFTIVIYVLTISIFHNSCIFHITRLQVDIHSS